MSVAFRTLAVAVVALCGASVASAQNPTGVRPVTVVAPKPGYQIQRDMMWEDAYRQAKLWQMYQPTVVVVNNPLPYQPWGVGLPLTSNPWGPTFNQPGAMWNSTNSFYRNNTLGWPHQPGGLRVIR
jgi:hypothetical protein